MSLGTRLFLPAMLALLPILSACDTNPPMTQAMLMAIAGDWQRVDGNSSLRFYRDGTVMVRLADRNPPINFVSSFELLKDGHIDIASGDMWLGPIAIEWKQGASTMRVTIPDDEKHTMAFTKKSG